MPVQFVCEHCDKLLKVGRRKIGAEVACPTCGKPLIVPNEEAAALSVAMRQLSRSPREEQPLPEFVVYDDLDPPPGGGGRQVATEPAWPSLSTSAHSGVGAPAVATEPPPPAVARSAAPRGRGGSDRVIAVGERFRAPRESMLLISRNTLYVQAALFSVVALAAFGAGYLVGLGREPAATTAAEEAAGDRADSQVVDGTLVYTSRANRVVPDAGAVVMAIPEGQFPNPQWPTRGLAPQDPQPSDGSQLMHMITEAGAVYTRTDEDGMYLLTVPRSGRYVLLFVSRNSRRPSGAAVEAADLERLRRYFSPATDMVGRYKYAFKTVELAGGGITRQSHDFGVDGR
jgi:hypothetical protein